MILELLVFILGLCCGSFVNMLTYRTAVRYKIKDQRSKIKTKIQKSKFSCCDFCGRQLGWYENIPAVSWVVQGGRSRCCGNPLPREYPFVELLVGFLFLVVYIGRPQGSPVQLGIGAVIITLLVFSAVFDAKYMILPDFSTYILTGIAFLGVVFDERNIIPYLLSAIGAGGFLGLLYLITKGRGMGGGDVKLAVFMGLFLGWPKVVVAFYAAFVAGAVVGLGLMAAKRVKAKTPIPFGPFLIGGTLFAWYYGSRIWW